MRQVSVRRNESAARSQPAWAESQALFHIWDFFSLSGASSALFQAKSVSEVQNREDPCVWPVPGERWSWKPNPLNHKAGEGGWMVQFTDVATTPGVLALLALWDLVNAVYGDKCKFVNYKPTGSLLKCDIWELLVSFLSFIFWRNKICFYFTYIIWYYKMRNGPWNL